MSNTMTNSPNLAAKNLLAKLMAAEDLTVEHDPRAQTASFNMDTRVLTLPVWKDLDADTLDMLIGHEVSHALHTPAGRDPLMDACKTIDPKNPMVAKDYLNVVEDARIERMIKARFPGLKRSFAAGYRDLLKRDLFGLKKVGDLKTLPLIDRINLQYKIGWLVDVPFTAKELSLAQRVAATLTWDDVVALSKEIYEFAKEQAKGNDPDKGDEGNDEGDEDGEGSDKGRKGDDADGDEADAAAPSDGKGDEDGESDTKGMENGEDDADEEGDSYGDGEESDEQDGETADEGDNADADEGTEGGEKSRPTDQDADSEADSNKSDTTEESEGKQDEAKVTDGTPAPVSQTLRNAEEGMKTLIDADAKITYYADLPEIDKGFVVTLKQSQESLRKWAGTSKKKYAEAAYAAWKTQNAGAVQVLATEFDRRKAADAHKRMVVAETGSIDPNRLHAYRIAEDIFLQNAYVKDGKNHGLVLLLDMSGSMAQVFHDTMIQLVTLAHFCRRVNIPFTFYGYTDRAHAFGNDPCFKKGAFGADAIKTRLVTLLQDGMKMNEFTETCGLLLLSSYDCGSHLRVDHPTVTAIKGYSKGWGGVDWMCLDNTPTNAALLGLPAIMEEFKRVKRVQVMNLIVLTDGEASDDMSYLPRHTDAYKAKVGVDQYGYAKSARVVWRDSKRRKDYAATKTYKSNYAPNREYDLNREEQSATLMDIIRDRVGGKTVCIHLASRKHGSEYAASLTQRSMVKDGSTVDAAQAAVIATAREKAVAAWKDNDWVAIANTRGFNEYILVRCDNSEKAVSTDDVNLTDKNALRDLRKAFTKSMAQTKANRPLLTRVADLVSK